MPLSLYADGKGLITSLNQDWQPFILLFIAIHALISKRSALRMHSNYMYHDMALKGEETYIRAMY